jgi:hypothetical protein
MRAMTKKTVSRQAQSAEAVATTSVKPTSLNPPINTRLTSDQRGATSRSAIVVVGTIRVAMTMLSLIVSVALLAHVL